MKPSPQISGRVLDASSPEAQAIFSQFDLEMNLKRFTPLRKLARMRKPTQSQSPHGQQVARKPADKKRRELKGTPE